MSLPYIPYTSGVRPSELHVYAIEECQSCARKAKREFKMGDYIMEEAGICGKVRGGRQSF